MATKPSAPRAKAPAAAAPADTGPTVTVVRTGDVKEVPFKEGMSVRQILKNAGHTPNRDNEVRVNNQACADLDTVLKAGDQVMILGRIRGA